MSALTQSFRMSSRVGVEVGLSGSRPPSDGVGDRGFELGQPIHDLVVGQVWMAEQALVVAEAVFTAGGPQLLGEADQSELVPDVVGDAGCML